MENIHTPNDVRNYDKIDDNLKELLNNWIKSNLNSIKGMNKHHTSYSYKHYFEYEMVEKGTPRYVDNGTFKGAMIKCGFISNNQWDINWYFNVSEKSITALKKRGIRC